MKLLNFLIKKEVWKTTKHNTLFDVNCALQFLLLNVTKYKEILCDEEHTCVNIYHASGQLFKRSIKDEQSWGEIWRTMNLKNVSLKNDRKQRKNHTSYLLPFLAISDVALLCKSFFYFFLFCNDTPGPLAFFFFFFLFSFFYLKWKHI